MHTSLETRYPVNLTWLGLDGLPETKGIVEVLREWGEFRVATVRRRTRFRLDKCEERLHIVLGRLLAFVKIDEIIKLIRASEDQAAAKEALQKKYRFTERQAEDIVNLRLGQLTKLDGVKLNDERKALEAERKELKSLLGDEKELKKLVVKELGDDAKKYGDERRTLIKTAERAQIERTVVEEPLTVILSKKGWIRARTGHALDVTTLTFKEGDALGQTLECKTTDSVIVLAGSGKTFTVAAADVPSGRGDGVPVNTLVNAGSDAIVWMASGNPSLGCEAAAVRDRRAARAAQRRRRRPASRAAGRHRARRRGADRRKIARRLRHQAQEPRGRDARGEAAGRAHRQARAARQARRRGLPSRQVR